VCFLFIFLVKLLDFIYFFTYPVSNLATDVNIKTFTYVRTSREVSITYRASSIIFTCWRVRVDTKLTLISRFSCHSVAPPQQRRRVVIGRADILFLVTRTFIFKHYFLPNPPTALRRSDGLSCFGVVRISYSIGSILDRCTRKLVGVALTIFVIDIESASDGPK